MRVPRTRQDPTRTEQDAAPPADLRQQRVALVGLLRHLRQHPGEATPRCAASRTASSSSRTAGCRWTSRPAPRSPASARTGGSGLGMLHTLFTLEHNAICDALKAAHPQMGDDELFGTAQLVNSALIAKIHTVEWTPAIVAHPALKVGMRVNWWGLMGERLHRRFGPDRQQRGDQRHPGLARRPPRRAVPADRGVRVGLPAAPAAAGRARGAQRRGRPARSTRGTVRGRHPQERRGLRHRRGHARRPLLLLRRAAPRCGRACTTSPGGCRTSPCPTGCASTSAPSTSSATASAGCPATTSSAASCTSRRPTSFDDLTDNPVWAARARGDLRRRRAGRPADRHARRDATEGLRVQRHRVPRLHPDGVAGG